MIDEGISDSYSEAQGLWLAHLNCNTFLVKCAGSVAIEAADPLKGRFFFRKKLAELGLEKIFFLFLVQHGSQTASTHRALEHSGHSITYLVISMHAFPSVFPSVISSSASQYLYPLSPPIFI